MIPKQLSDPKFRFIKVRKKQKIPLEKDWTTKNNYSFSNASLQDWLKKGGNIGLVTGIGDLFVIDFDDMAFQEKFLPKLPKTLTQKSGSGGLHLIYKTDNPESFKILNKEKNTLADFQGKGKQIIVAPSIHPNGKYYEFCNNEKIATIPLSEIKAIFADYLKPVDVKKTKKALDKPDLKKILQKYGVDTSKNPTGCIWHDSKGGKCFSFNEQKQYFNCFHCDKGGDVVKFVQEAERCDFKKACQILEITLPEDKLPLNINREEILILLAQQKKNEATELIVEDFLKKNHVKTTRNDHNAEIFTYENGIYIPNGKTRVLEQVRSLTGAACTQALCSNCVTKVQIDTYIDENVFFNTNYPHLLPLKNGILNIKTKELLPFSPEYIFFGKLPISYEPNAKCPQIMKFLKEIQPTEEAITLLCEIAGFCLYKKYSLHKWFLFHGKGRNGKGAYFRLIEALLGKENVAGVALQDLEEKEFALAGLHGKFANIGGDIPSKPLNNTARIKACTGEDLLAANRKFLSYLSFVSYAKQLHSANELPQINDFSDGFFARLVLIDFPVQFIPKNEYDDKQNKTNYGILSPEIEDKIRTPEELSGFLNVALSHLEDILTRKSFSYSLTIEQIKLMYYRKSDSVCAFYMDNCSRDVKSDILADDFLEKYLEYCDKRGFIPKSDKDINKSMTQKLGCLKKRKMKPVKEFLNEQEVMKQVMCWVGVTYK